MFDPQLIFYLDLPSRPSRVKQRPASPPCSERAGHSFPLEEKIVHAHIRKSKKDTLKHV
jgi:hypothetical protein